MTAAGADRTWNTGALVPAAIWIIRNGHVRKRSTFGGDLAAEVVGDRRSSRINSSAGALLGGTDTAQREGCGCREVAEGCRWRRRRPRLCEKGRKARGSLENRAQV